MQSILKGGTGSRKSTMKRGIDLTETCSAPLLRLRNNGNFCYSNASVVALLSSPLFRDYLLSETNRNVGDVHEELRKLIESPKNTV